MKRYDGCSNGSAMMTTRPEAVANVLAASGLSSVLPQWPRHQLQQDVQCVMTMGCISVYLPWRLPQ